MTIAENFAKIKKIMLPKDYIAYMLSGSFCTDVSDASGMLLFDVKNKTWFKYYPVTKEQYDEWESWLRTQLIFNNI